MDSNGVFFVIYMCIIIQVYAATSFDDKDGDVLYSRVKKSTDVSNYDLVTSVTHTLCQPKAPSATEVGVSAADKTLIVDLHNQYRSQETASDMFKMKWDDDVAVIAQKWAEHCDTTHDENKARSIPARFSIGQNLATGASDFTQAINLWQAEKSQFTYNGANSLQATGHYTQINWAASKLIGCGFAKCGTTNYHVCNYAPAGNVASQFNTPYKAGAACADCPNNCDSNGKLCVCENTCWFGRKMNPATCTCDCLNDVYTAPSCKLDCDKPDPSTGGYSCSGSFGQTLDCNSFAAYCPHKCNYCPAADYRVVEKALAKCGGSGGGSDNNGTSGGGSDNNGTSGGGSDNNGGSGGGSDNNGGSGAADVQISSILLTVFIAILTILYF